MNSKQEKFVNHQLTQNLYRHTLFISMANPLVGASLAWAFADFFNMDYVYQWLAVLGAFTACRLLGYIFYKRNMAENGDLIFYRWFHISVSALLGVAYGVAFAAIILFGPSDYWSLVLAIVIALSACSSIEAISSFKTMLAFNIPLLMITAGAYIFMMQTSAYFMAGSLLVFLVIYGRATFSQNQILKDMYKQEYEQSNVLTEQKNQLYSYQELIIKDKAIGIYNRNFFNYILDAEVHRAKRTGNKLILVIVRVDSFEDYKKHYGHEQTLKCTRSIAGLLKTLVHRGGESVSMFDENTFTLVLPNIEENQGIQFSKKIAKKFADAKIVHEATTVSRQKHITLSIAISAFCHQHPIDVDAFVDQTFSKVDSIELEGGNSIECVELESDVVELNTRAQQA